MEKMDALQTLMAMEDIKRAKARYCRYVDQKDWKSLEGLFAPETKITFLDVKGTILNEFQDAKEFMIACSILDNAVSIHHVHNPEVEMVSAIEAKAIFSMVDQIYFPKDVDSRFKSHIGYGFYHNTYVKHDGSWKIKALKLYRTKMDVQ